MAYKYPQVEIETKGWAREEQFHFFKSFTQPFFNVHTEVDITLLYLYCKRNGVSVFLAYLYVTLLAARATEQFRLRLTNDKVVLFEGLDISTTVLKHNQTISFVSLPFQEKLNDFVEQSRQIIEQAKESNRLFIGHQGPDTLHVTTLPWFPFRGTEHAFSSNPEEAGIPKIAFGQIDFRPDQVILPISIALHHALADGFHMHLFLEQMKGFISAFGFVE